MLSLLEVEAPLAQAKRCLDQWLDEEGRVLSPRLRNRAAALMARYFLHEAQVNDVSMLSFLRHYSGFGEIDFEDPMEVRRELAAVLDKTVTASEALPPATSHRVIYATAIAVFVTSVFWLWWNVAHMTVTLAQQTSLRAAVDRRAETAHAPHAKIWADLKRELNVRRYQEIRRADYNAVMEKLQADR